MNLKFGLTLKLINGFFLLLLSIETQKKPSELAISLIKYALHHQTPFSSMFFCLMKIALNNFIMAVASW